MFACLRITDSLLGIDNNSRVGRNNHLPSSSISSNKSYDVLLQTEIHTIIETHLVSKIYRWIINRMGDQQST